MRIKQENNKIYFNNDDISYATVTLDNSAKTVFLELIKVTPEFRNKKIATNMMKEIIKYVKSLGYKFISLSPLPLDSKGLDLSSLIKFYKKLNFKKSLIPNRAYPYLMDRYI